VLSEPWVLVTNQSDKEVQLYKISHLDFMVRRHMKRLATSPEDFSKKPAGAANKSVSLPPSAEASGERKVAPQPSGLGRQKSTNTLRSLLSAGQGVLSPVSPSGKSWSVKFRGMPSFKVREFYGRMTGAGPSGANADAEEDAFAVELRELARSLKLEEKLAVMREWCDEEEVESMEDLARWVRKKEYGDALVAKLGLKPGKAKASKLLETIAERATQQPLQQQMSGRI
jgi:hypothetical protein